MTQELIKTKKGYYYCPFCNKAIKIIKELSKYVCPCCNHKLKRKIVKRFGEKYSILYVDETSEYCPNCGHGLETELHYPFSGGIHYFCINPDCKNNQNEIKLKKTKYKSFSSGENDYEEITEA